MRPTDCGNGWDVEPCSKDRVFLVLGQAAPMGPYRVILTSEQALAAADELRRAALASRGIVVRPSVWTGVLVVACSLLAAIGWPAPLLVVLWRMHPELRQPLAWHWWLPSWRLSAVAGAALLLAWWRMLA